MPRGGNKRLTINQGFNDLGEEARRLCSGEVSGLGRKTGGFKRILCGRGAEGRADLSNLSIEFVISIS